MTESSRREVARRLFAREFNDATYAFKESDDELAPNYTLLPTGERVNRLFFAGTLTETGDVGSDSEYWQGRVVDPTGTFYVYAGQYQPEAANTLRKIDTPTYVTVVGKPRTYETDDGNTNVAVRPESITEVDEPTRDRWVVETADQTIERLRAFDRDTNDYAQMAREEYGDSLSSYREAAIAALESLDTTDEPAIESEERKETTDDAQSGASASDPLDADGKGSPETSELGENDGDGAIDEDDEDSDGLLDDNDDEDGTIDEDDAVDNEL